MKRGERCVCRGDGFVCFWCALYADERTRGWVELEGFSVSAGYFASLIARGVPVKQCGAHGVVGPPWLARLWHVVSQVRGTTLGQWPREAMLTYGRDEELALEGEVLLRLTAS